MISFDYIYKNIPIDFDPKIYIDINEDLSDMTELNAKNHYEYTGYLENRKYKYSQFDLNYNVYIYCCAKSGSSTLYNTFNKNGYNALHVHNSKYFTNNCVESTINSNIFNIIEKSMQNNNVIYIIDSYRTPIERKISSFFQHYKNYNTDINYINNLLDKKIYLLENYTSINEVLDYFKLPHFNVFDFKKKYNLFKYKNIVFIKLRFEDIDEWENILSSIFDTNIKLYNKNISKNKAYFNEYKIIKSTYNIPNFMIDVIKNDNEFKIYNTEESQKKYLEYWTSRSKHYTFINIPDNFDPKTYISLNSDLSYMTEIEAKLHYEYTGYLENRPYFFENAI